MQLQTHYEKSLALNTKLENHHGIIGITSNLAMIHADMKSYDKALDYFYKTLKGREKGSDKVSIISGHLNIAIVLNNLVFIVFYVKIIIIKK